MSEPIRAMAVIEPLEGKEAELLEFLREFYNFMREKNYSRDFLYRDMKQSGRFVHMRVWSSDAARDQAQHDPEVHKFWLRLPEICSLSIIYEELETVFSTYEGMVEKIDRL